MSAIRLFFVSALFALFSIGASANTFYVSKSGSNSNSGLSWSQAKLTIQAAIAIASANDSVLVAGSSIAYTENVVLASGVSIYGGYDSVSGNRNISSFITTINGNGTGSVISVASAASSFNTRIDGFSITNGLITTGGGLSGNGGGIAMNGSSATIVNNIIFSNVGTNNGGGIYCLSSSAVIVDNIIRNNTTTSRDGGGIYCGGTTAAPNNVTIANNLIMSNTGKLGGGIFTINGPSKIVNNTIIYNTGTDTLGLSGGIRISNNSPLVANNIFAFNNTGVSNSTTGTPNFKNNDVFGSSPNYTGLTPDSSNISVDPGFVNSTSGTGDYHLNGASACIDTGGDSYVIAGFNDLDGNARIAFAHVDIGAYESQTGIVQVETPIFSPDGGVSPATVTITTATSGATIRYTTDGSTPTSSSPIYTAPVSISGTVTLKAVAFKTGFVTSAVKSANYRPALIIHVSPAGNDTNSGLTWAAAKATLAGGISAAQIAGDQVWVMAGTYTENITLKSGVLLYGGFSGSENSLNQRNFNTFISKINGNSTGSCIICPVGSDVTTRVDGFTIVSGLAAQGGGVYARNTALTIVNNFFYSNVSAGDGGALYLNNSTVTVAYNRFNSNVAQSVGYGGAIYIFGTTAVPVVYSNLLDGNQARLGGGIFTNDIASGEKIINNTIVNNIATNNEGGGIRIDNGSPLISNNIIAFNSSVTQGAGISAISPSNPTIRYNDVYNNSPDDYGFTTPGINDISVDPRFAGVSDYHLTSGSNCIDSGNDADVIGSFDIEGNQRIKFAHVDRGAYELQFQTIDFTGTVKLNGYTGTILPSVSVIIDSGSAVTVTLTQLTNNTGTFDIQIPSTGNHSVRVKPDGFLAQRANLASGQTAFTFDGGTATNHSGLIPGDSNGDNIIDDTDLLAVINNFLSSPPSGGADFNGDNIVDDTDLLDVINNFLAAGDN